MTLTRLKQLSSGAFPFFGGVVDVSTSEEIIAF